MGQIDLFENYVRKFLFFSYFWKESVSQLLVPEVNRKDIFFLTNLTSVILIMKFSKHDGRLLSFSVFGLLSSSLLLYSLF